LTRATLARHRDRLFEFVRDLLGDYVNHLRSLHHPKDQKEFNDPIWQTIVVQPFEIALFDSPLLQRLRFIRQLGVAHWVYPGATHTRFEHTLGVLHQVQNLISAINKRAAETQVAPAYIDPQMTNLLRLIAICHDIGHGVMSHVSENAMQQSSLIEDLLLEFSSEVQNDKTKLSELAAYYMVGSPAFSGLLDAVIGLYRSHSLPENPIPKIQHAIIGRAISDQFPLLHELINGPFDADKLDYLPRDARMAGVPVVTDIPRLIQKVRALPVPQDKLPEKVAAQVAGGHPQYIITGIAHSGGRTLDELMLGRALLFDKIYRHQKVRAAEAMVAAILANVSRLAPDSQAMIPYHLVDEQLIYLDPPLISKLIRRNLANGDGDAVEVACDLALRLRERRLFVRSFAFSQHMPLDPYRGDERQRAGIDQLIRDASDSERRSELVEAIALNVTRILDILGEKELLRRFPIQRLFWYLWIDPPAAPSRGGDIDNAHLITQDGNILRFKEETAEARAWTDAYPLARDLGYIFSVEELSRFAYLAAEKEVRVRFGVKLPRSMLDYAKQSHGVLEPLRRRLKEGRFYDDAPLDIQPVPLRLTRADVTPRLNELVRSMRGYCGPHPKLRTSDSEPPEPLLSSDRIIDWLRQFDDDQFAEAALEVVARTRLIGRRDIVGALRGFLDRQPEFRDAYACPLGEPRDSSVIATYMAGDVSDLKVESLGNALADSDARPILFIDDFVGSGRQAVTMLESWLGVPPTYDLGEDRKGIAEQLREALKARRLGFIFAAGLTVGVQLLEARASGLGLNATVAVLIGEAELPKAFVGEPAQDSQSRFRDRCQAIGRELLTDGDPRHTSEWVEERALGYGNRGLLVVLPYNTPTQTLTCLWAEGRVGGRLWSPLFPRRKKR
jgi:deoxynucleoside triphosphate triphosphohydrolase SAMHD1